METLWQTISPLEAFIRPNSHFDYEYKLYKEKFESHSLVDDKTWSDLNMNAIFHKMNYNLTAIGEMKLYACLRGMLFQLRTNHYLVYLMIMLNLEKT